MPISLWPASWLTTTKHKKNGYHVGSQFSSPKFPGFVLVERIQFNMDGKGRAIDNIFIERFWRSIKYEKIFLEPSHDGLELNGKIKACMEFYNTRRQHQSPGYKKPEEVFRQAS